MASLNNKHISHSRGFVFFFFLSEKRRRFTLIKINNELIRETDDYRLSIEKIQKTILVRRKHLGDPDNRRPNFVFKFNLFKMLAPAGLGGP